MVIIKKSVVEVEVALELYRKTEHCCSMMQKKPIVHISNKGMGSEKTSQ